MSASSSWRRSRSIEELECWAFSVQAMHPMNDSRRVCASQHATSRTAREVPTSRRPEATRCYWASWFGWRGLPQEVQSNPAYFNCLCNSYNPRPCGQTPNRPSVGQLHHAAPASGQSDRRFLRTVLGRNCEVVGQGSCHAEIGARPQPSTISGCNAASSASATQGNRLDSGVSFRRG